MIRTEYFMAVGVPVASRVSLPPSLGYVSAIDSNGRTIWIVDAHRDDGKRFVVRADELLTAFLELKSAINQSKILVKDQNSCY
jgi:hypothetical protein